MKSLIVEIEHSGNTPHFGGPAWVRRGSDTVQASEEVFQALIDIRSATVFELTKWVGKAITIEGEFGAYPPEPGLKNFRWVPEKEVMLISVNRYWATFEEDLRLSTSGAPLKRLHSEPIEKLILSYDNGRQRLKLWVKL